MVNNGLTYLAEIIPGNNNNNNSLYATGNHQPRLAEPEYIQELKSLQTRIMSLQDSNDLQQGEGYRLESVDLWVLMSSCHFSCGNHCRDRTL